MLENKAIIRISVRNLVEFILRTGDIDNRRQGGGENAMAEGSRIHRNIQRNMGPEYHAEVSLKYTFEGEKYDLLLEGRADGIIQKALPDGGEHIVIDEIKGTYRDIQNIKKPNVIHLAQAKCYAYIYAMLKKTDVIGVRMTYCNIETEELKYFHEDYTMQELTIFMEDLISAYRKWADLEFKWKQKCRESIQKLEFPFPYRDGQKELVSYVYQTIYHKRKLFIQAPTGVGKTISTVFPAIKAIGEQRAEKLFYFTAKTITRTVAVDTFALLRKHGLAFKTTVITAKEKICPMQETECNPDICPYAKGHYDRINDAVYELLISEENYTREEIEKSAQKHKVCPFEMNLDMTLFSDGIVCDYNYLFDPHVYLKRFFSDGMDNPYLFLVDEAHNLLDRGREMYSAVLKKEDFLTLKKTVKDIIPKMEKNLDKCNKEMLILKRECENCEIVEFITPVVNACSRLFATMEKYLQENEDSPLRKEILDFYFEIKHFLEVYELVDENYVMYTEMQENGEFILKLFCVNPSKNLEGCMQKGKSTILFSATFLPIQYYKNLLGGEENDYEVYAKSTFLDEKKALFIANDVTSKYSKRTEEEYFKIAKYICDITSKRHGNYMIFFPSHLFLKKVYELYQMHFALQDGIECIIQTDSMNETEREDFLRKFSRRTKEDSILEKSLLGFCVLGGIFSEGIDLKSDALIGAIIVGTGLPQICNEREIVKDYFDGENENGFDYAYRYPGMNKVLQAAGRVIRTNEDIGIVALLDERFLMSSYKRLYPREWKEIRIADKEEIGKKVERFWDEWL